MTDTPDRPMGPIDWVVIEWDGRQPDPAAIAPEIIALVERGIVRIIDIAFVSKDADGDLVMVDLTTVDEGGPFGAFAGAASGVLAHEDLAEAAAELELGTSAAVIVWENTWVLPLAGTLRASGGELVARGRIDHADLVALLDAAEAVG